MDEQVWTFARNGQQLEIRRTASPDGTVLGIHGDGPPRTALFEDIERLISFQADFEKFLLATGWTFVGFVPDRRTGQERRHYSRLLTDRRRWWTDGTTAAERERDARDLSERDPREPRRRRGLSPR